MKLCVYLNFEGNAMEAMEFYQEALGGEFKEVMKYSSMPDYNEMEEFKGIGDYILHGMLCIDEFIIHFSDSYEPVIFGNSTTINLIPDNVDSMNKIYQKLTIDAKEIIMPIEDTFWNARYANFIDKFGIVWQINYQY